MKYTLLPHRERRKNKLAAEPTPVRYLSAKDVARRYRLSVAWVHHCQGLRPYKRKIGKYLRFLESDLEEFEAYRAQWPRPYVTGKERGGREGYILENHRLAVEASDNDLQSQKYEEAKAKLKFDIL